MSNKIPNSRRNLDIAIDRILGKDVNPLQIRTLLANTIIGQMLPDGVMKGGSALKPRLAILPTPIFSFRLIL